MRRFLKEISSDWLLREMRKIFFLKSFSPAKMPYAARFNSSDAVILERGNNTILV